MKTSSLMLFLTLVLIISCERYPDPSYSTLMSFQFQFYNSPNQKLIAGSPYSGTVEFGTWGYQSNPGDSLRIVFSALKGGGSVGISSDFTDSLGVARTTWQLGTESCEQVLRASAYLPDGKYLTSTDLYAYGFRHDEWDEISLSPDGQMSWMAADTVNDITFMIAQGVLYRQGANYFEWYQVYDNTLSNPRTIMIDGNNVFYIATWSCDLYKSTDHGESWIKCTRPFAEPTSPLYLHVSNDNRLWAFNHGQYARYSDDEGTTWNLAGEELSKHGFGWVYRLSNGWLFFHGSDCCSLYRSEDDGATWIKVTTPPPGYTYSVFVSDKDEIFVLSHIFGATIYKSTDLGATFVPVVSVGPQFNTTTEQNIFHKWGDTYYVVIPGYGILKSPDLTDYDETYYVNYDLLNLFLDHSGVLVAKDWDYKTVYYRKNTE